MADKVDSLFEKLADKLMGSIRLFAASLFLIFSLGMVYGVYFFSFDPTKDYLLFAPPVLALFAYYNRDFAVFILVGVLVLLIL